VIKKDTIIINGVKQFHSLAYFKQYLLKSVLNVFTILFIALFLVTACTTNYAPVEQRSGASYSSAKKNIKKKHRGKTPGYYRVKAGDTLYSIAWMYGQDYKRLAYRNKIKAPYRIFAGERLRLSSLPSKKNKSAYKKATKTKKPAYSKNRKKTSLVKNKKKTRVKKNSKKSTTSRYKTKTKKTARKTTGKNNKTSYQRTKHLTWIWPVKGKVIQRYVPKRGKKGIDISGGRGSVIKASEAGKVVYSGQGLVGYGRLVIIKHNDVFLSAYAHNQSLLINEGQVVKKGQAIARLGRSGTDRYKLHFEIRKNGKPVNPMTYLPH